MSSGSEYDSEESGSGGERGFKLKTKSKHKDKKEKDKPKDKKDKKDKDKKDKKEGKDKKDKDKKDKDKKDKDKTHEVPHGHGGSSTFSGPGYGLMGGGAAADFLSSTTSSTAPSAPAHFQAPAQIPMGGQAPPPYVAPPGFAQAGGVDIKQPQFPGAPATPAANPPPPSGYRVPLRTDANFPGPDQTGPPVTYEPDGVTPVFIGSALFETSVHPCKIGAHLQPPVSVAYGGAEHGHHGRYDLLPFAPDQMEWVYASHGQIPPGRRPIEGGYEENGAKLYHALANVNGIRVPGKTGEHLGGANVGFGGQEHAVQQYEILCWRY